VNAAISPTTRAKVKVDTVTASEYSQELKLTPVVGGNPEDNSFAKATPTGSIQLTVTNKDLWGKFKPGDMFFVDFTRCPNQP